MSPRYPQAHVAIRSDNPLALASAVRLALRQAGADRDEIRRFSDAALSAQGADDRNLLRLCQDWVRLDTAT